MAEPWPAAPHLHEVPDRLQVVHRTTGSRSTQPPGAAPHDGEYQFTVLHIVRNMGGGVATAIMDYAAAVPEARHVVLCDLETSFKVAESLPFPILHRMPTSFRGAVTAIRATIDEVAPDVVHAHSSFAGVYARAGLRRRELRTLIYSPHCYAFFRRDVSVLARAVFWLIEALLTLRATAVMTCSPDEERAARRLPRSRTTYVPNVANVPEQISISAADAVERTQRHLVVSVGRLCTQKDPRLFLDAALASRAEGLDYDWLWVGGGDDQLEDLFREHKVDFTGWVPRTTAIAVLAQADIYLHTAAWEGAPISVLEAAAFQVPVLGRRTPALASLGLAPLWKDIPELMGMLRDGVNGEAIARSREQTSRLLTAHTVEAQRSALIGAYAAARARADGRRGRTAAVRSAG